MKVKSSYVYCIYLYIKNTEAIKPKVNPNLPITAVKAEVAKREAAVVAIIFYNLFSEFSVKKL